MKNNKSTVGVRVGQKGGFQSKQDLTAIGKEMGMGKGRTQMWL